MHNDNSSGEDKQIKEIIKNEIIYKINEKDGVASVGFNKFTKSKIFIPQYIDHEGKKYIITSIDTNAFTFSQTLYQIEFANNSMIQSIQNAAFSWAAFLTNISIPSSVTHIDDMVFSNCKNLKEIKFQPDSKLQQIGNYAFSDTLIEHIEIPSTVSELKKKWLFFTPRLKKVTIMPNNKLYKNYENDNRIVVGKSDINNDEYDSLIFVGRDVKTFVIPPSIKIISPQAFALSKIEYVFISPHVKKICKCAFQSCLKLKNVEIPKNSELQKIGKFAFNESFIEKVFIPPQITKIGYNTFQYCSNLRKIEIPQDSKLQIIDTEAFKQCSFESIYVPSQVKNTCYVSLAYCKELQIIETGKNSNLVSNIDVLMKIYSGNPIIMIPN